MWADCGIFEGSRTVVLIKRLNRKARLARTVYRLGLLNVLRVVWFRLGIKLGLNPVNRLSYRAIFGPFFSKAKVKAGTLSDADSVSTAAPLKAFGWIEIDPDTVPDWQLNVLNGIRCRHAHLPWYEIPDFISELGDIKGVWELSRFDWVVRFAREAREGSGLSFAKLETWLQSWVSENPPYNGPNWKCGQEASIRVMHLAMAAIVLNQASKPERALLELVEAHLQRIAPTILYAIAQDNNHGTSEAAALYIGGSWLEANGFKNGRGWYLKGKKWLENRAARLIERDGSFSQYSLTYHRVMLDTFSMVEVWRRALKLEALAPAWYIRSAAATQWLLAMVQPGGDAPNLGANDGARLLPLARTDYRDFRPSVQLASALFCGQRAISETGDWDNVLALLEVPEATGRSAETQNQQFDDGGYAALRNGNNFAVFRYPRFRFRPGQADLLHLDFWLDGRNLLRDGGSFSYNTHEPWQSYFPGVQSHNTVQFDGRDQMPRLSRFLYGDWLKTERFRPITTSPEGVSIQAGYCDYRGARHTRTLLLAEQKLTVNDELKGFSTSAVLRWRLSPGNWQLNGHSIVGEGILITLDSTVPIKRFELVTGWESRYYGEKTELPVLEVEVAQATTLTTEIHWDTH